MTSNMISTSRRCTDKSFVFVLFICALPKLKLKVVLLEHKRTSITKYYTPIRQIKLVLSPELGTSSAQTELFRAVHSVSMRYFLSAYLLAYILTA